jgi:hypothetical protein
MRLVPPAVCLCLIALAACERDAGSRVSLRVEGQTNANPSMAAHGELVAVAWSASSKAATDVYAASSSDGGRTFGAPIRVNDIPGDARINSEFPPRIVFVPHGSSAPEIVVVWSTKRSDTTSLVWSRSTDGGTTFAPAALVPGTRAKGSRGWQSVAVDSAGRVLVMWLDHRDVPAMSAEHHHGSGAAAGSKASDDATARAAPSKLYFASLTDSAPISITGSVCYCCKTSLVARGENVYAVWRHVYPGSARNIAFAMSKDGGRTFSGPVRVSDDHWQIDGCPENGPAIAVDDRGRAHVAWVTPPDGKSDTPLGLFYASSDNGTSFHQRVLVPGSFGPAAHAQIVERGGVLTIGFDEISGTSRRVVFATLTPKADSPLGFAVDLLRPESQAETGWPVLASTSRGVLAGWVSRSGSTSEIVVSSLGKAP